MRDFWKEHPTAEDMLKALYAPGDKSMSMIADIMGAHFGVRITRNQLIGKSHRLKIERHPVDNFRRGVVRKPRGEGEPETRGRRKPKPVASVPAAPRGQNVVRLAGPLVCEPIGLLALTRHTCRWPVDLAGSDEVHFCGAQPQADGPYCAEHKRRSIAPNSKGMNTETKQRKFASFMRLREAMGVAA